LEDKSVEAVVPVQETRLMVMSEFIKNLDVLSVFLLVKILILLSTPKLLKLRVQQPKQLKEKRTTFFF
jgi:hypothetical protein